MIVGIGTDIMDIDRIKKTIEQYGDVFLNKYFTNEEQDYAKSKPAKMVQSLASSWATKEAVSKALGTGIRDDVTLKSIGLYRNENGAPSVVLSGGADKKALDLCGDTGYKCFVSISHDKNIVNAFVVLERKYV